MDLSQLPQTVSQTIDVLADKLKVPTLQLMNAAVRGVMVEGIISLIIGVIGVIGIPVLYRKAFIYLKNEVRGEWEIGAFLMTLVAIPLFAVSFSGVYFGFIQAFAPDYWLLKSILNF